MYTNDAHPPLCTSMIHSGVHAESVRKFTSGADDGQIGHLGMGQQDVDVFEYFGTIPGDQICGGSFPSCRRWTSSIPEWCRCSGGANIGLSCK